MNAATFSAPLSIDLGERSYDIVIGTGLLSDPRSFDLFAAAVSRAVIVTNTTVAPIYAKRLQQTLARKYSQVYVIELPDGEAYKSGETLDSIFTALLQMGADRKTWLFALGGGVVGDITGFAAACYMRGVPYVQVPTTLLAQVDSSVGGKTAINHPLGKNMIGAFYQPRLVVADIETLRTLPENQLRAGLAEVIKYGPIYDADFLRWLDAHLDALLSLDSQAIMYAVRRSCEIKAEIVAQDECENGIRAILNLGHTFGHAIETGAGYGAWLHGEAVACGMVMAADLSCRLGLLSRDQYDALRALIVRAGLPVLAPAWGVERYLELMLRDKKNEGRGIRFVLLEGLGHAVVRSAPQNLVEAVLHAHQQPAG